MFSHKHSPLDSGLTPDDLQLFYDKYFRLIVFLVQKYAPDQGLREDLVQEAWLHLLENIDTLCTLNEKQIAGYIATTVKRLCRNSRVPQEEELDEAHAPGMDGGNDERLIAGEIVNALSWEDRQLLYLKYIFGYTSQELAGMYRTTPVNIRAMVSRARKRLAKKVERKEEESW